MPKNYFKNYFFSDLKAGFITGVVALPLAIAFAIASGVPPVMGLYTAVFAGIIGAMFGSSKFSISGPTGAMAVIILAIVHNFGINGLLLAGFLAGIIQVIFGLLKFGKIVKFIPLPIVSGFTAGIGLIIFVGQVPNALGLLLEPQETALQTVFEVIKHFGSFNLIAFGIAFGTVFLMWFAPRFFSRFSVLKNVPASLFGLVLFTAATYFFLLPIPLIGEIPQGFPLVSFPEFDFSILRDILPAAFTIALLGSIESLLCAVVCDSMSSSKHDSAKELVGQGVANIAMPFFGGIPATAAIARSAVNIREGAKTRYAVVIHSLLLFLVLIFFAPAAEFVPKAFLAGVLMFVSAKMINLNEFKTILHVSRHEAVVFAITFLLTVFTDLVFAVQVGMLFALFMLFIELSNITDFRQLQEFDSRDKKFLGLVSSKPNLKENVGLYTIHGPFFFGAMNMFDRSVNTFLDIKKPIVIILMEHVPFIDSTGIARITTFIQERQKENKTVLLAELNQKVKLALLKNKDFAEHMQKDLIFDDIHKAIEFAEKKLAEEKNAQ